MGLKRGRPEAGKPKNWQNQGTKREEGQGLGGPEVRGGDQEGGAGGELRESSGEGSGGPEVRGGT